MKASIRAVWLAAATTLTTLLASPAAAQIAPSGEWQYAQADENCRAYRPFGVGAGRVLLQLRSFGPGSAVETMVVSDQLPNEPVSVRYVELSWGDDVQDKNLAGLLGSVGGTPSVTVLSSYRPTWAFLYRDQGTGLFSRLSPAAETMKLRVVGGEPILLQTGSLEEPLRRLAQCEAELMDKWGWGRDYSQRIATAPEMRDPQLWFYKSIIYPAVQNLTRVSSILQLRLKVDAKGRVADCVVQSSPGSSLFGSKNCTALKKNGRFKPALDVQGQPVESYGQLSITFAHYD